MLRKILDGNPEFYVGVVGPGWDRPVFCPKKTTFVFDKNRLTNAETLYLPDGKYSVNKCVIGTKKGEVCFEIPLTSTYTAFPGDTLQFPANSLSITFDDGMDMSPDGFEYEDEETRCRYCGGSHFDTKCRCTGCGGPA